MRYTKKEPDKSVEAAQWDGTAAGAEMVINNVGTGRFAINKWKDRYVVIELGGSETLRLEKGDWLILHQEGPPSVMDDKTFRKNYGPAEPPVSIPTCWPVHPAPSESTLWWWDNGKFTNGTHTLTFTIV